MGKDGPPESRYQEIAEALGVDSSVLYEAETEPEGGKEKGARFSVEPGPTGVLGPADSLDQWHVAVSPDPDLGEYAKLVLHTLPNRRDEDTGVVSVSVGPFAEDFNLQLEEVERAWPLVSLWDTWRARA